MEIIREHSWKSVVVAIIAFICGISGIGLLYGVSGMNKGTDMNKMMLDHAWSVEFDNKIYTNVKLSDFRFPRILTQGDVVRISAYMPQTPQFVSPTLVVEGHNSTLEVGFDGEEAYSYGKDIVKNRGVVGSGEHYVVLRPEIMGRMITITYVAADFSGFSSIKPPFISDYPDVFRLVLSENFISIITGSFLIIFGILVMVAVGIALVYKANAGRLLWVGFLSICVGGWSTTYHRLTQLFGVPINMSTTIEYSCLMMGTLAVIMFFREYVWRLKSKTMKAVFTVLVSTQLVNYVLIWSLNMAKIIHMPSFLLVIQAYMLIEAVFIVVTMFMNIRRFGRTEMGLAIGFAVLVICILLDATSYGLRKYFGVSSFFGENISAFGTIVFVVFLVLNYCITFFKRFKDNHEREVLYKLAYTDGLTQLFNRRYCEEVMEALTKSKDHFTVFSLDLNDLKKINDTQGHNAGDDLISGFADILKETFDSGAVVGRMGGDEFVVIMDRPDGAKHDHEEDVKRLLANIEKKNATENRFKYSVSYGYADREEVGAVNGVLDSRWVYDLADNRMYEMKRLSKSSAVSTCFDR